MDPSGLAYFDGTNWVSSLEETTEPEDTPPTSDENGNGSDDNTKPTVPKLEEKSLLDRFFDIFTPNRDEKKKEEYNFTITYTRDNYEIKFYQNENGEIIIKINNESLILGKDIDIGDLIPIDSEITVPKGSELSVGNESIDVNLTGVKDLLINKSIEEYNKKVSSQQYINTMKKQKNLGNAFILLPILLILFQEFLPKTQASCVLTP